MKTDLLHRKWKLCMFWCVFVFHCIWYLKNGFCSIEKVRSWTSDNRRKAWSQEKKIPGGQWFIPWRTQECECCSILQWFHYIYRAVLGLRFIHTYLCARCKCIIKRDNEIMYALCTCIKMKLSTLNFGTDNNIQRHWQLHQCKEFYKISQVITIIAYTSTGVNVFF